VNTALTERPAAAAADLDFALVAGRTALIGARATAPLKLLQPRHRGTAAWACLSSLGGGLVDGDAICVSARVRSGAAAAVTTQASTKVYRGAASQRLEARVDGGALLVVAPDPVVCYAGARYAQRQSFELAPRADLAVVDWLTSGRAARGERWAFASYESRLSIRRAGRELLRDALRLDPAAGTLSARLGRWNVLGTAVALGPRLVAGARTMIEEAAREPLPRTPALMMTASALGDDGVIVRLAAESVEDCARSLRERLRWIWSSLGDDPWSARY